MLRVDTQAIKIHPLMPVARAAQLLGESIDSLEYRLERGEIRGEKRQISEKHSGKDCWFIYACDFEALLDVRVKACQTRLKTSPVQEERLAVDGLDRIFSVEAEILPEPQEIPTDQNQASFPLSQELSASVPAFTVSTEPQEEPAASLTEAPATINLHFQTGSHNENEAEQQQRDMLMPVATELWNQIQKGEEEKQQLRLRLNQLSQEIQTLHEEMSLLKIELLGLNPSGKNCSASGKVSLLARFKRFFGL
ncbi:MAG: hypothetical protein HY986_04410 [Candidatus Melainabacteria bacterium]|nr:hypothetical protein [Candidatus Melainabacteria bacterium]